MNHGGGGRVDGGAAVEAGPAGYGEVPGAGVRGIECRVWGIGAVDFGIGRSGRFPDGTALLFSERCCEALTREGGRISCGEDADFYFAIFGFCGVNDPCGPARVPVSECGLDGTTPTAPGGSAQRPRLFQGNPSDSGRRDSRGGRGRPGR